MAYLLRDKLFSCFPRGYKSGFIIYPRSKTPKSKNQYDVLCAFPVNAYSNNRFGLHGCGRSLDDPTGRSNHCNDQGITSLRTWFSHHQFGLKRNPNSVKGQCGFDTITKHAACSQ